jgi:hypothetical protein
MTKFLSIIAFFFATHLLSHAATDVEDTLLQKAQWYMYLMKDAGQCDDIQTNKTLKDGVCDLFSKNFVKIVNGTDVLAPYQNSEDGDSDPREALLKQLIAARNTYGLWTFPNEFIHFEEIPRERKVNLNARTLITKTGLQFSIFKILTFDENDKISRLDEVFSEVK